MILSTQRQTKKYETLCANRNVALLIHDFASDVDHDAENVKSGGRARFSITLNGVVREEQGALAEQYRQLHLRQNAEYAQFIIGPDNAIITVEIMRCRVCDINDVVRHFTRGEDQQWTETS